MKRIDLYLQENIKKYYENTAAENEMVEKVSLLYSMAKAYQENTELISEKNLNILRKAYLGSLNALDITTGDESTRKSRQLRKLIYELIESKVDNSLPMPKMTPRYKDDVGLVDVTENYLKFEMDRMLTENENDRSERATYIDGTSWYKVSWDSLDSTYERNGDLRVEVKLIDQVVPEPGVKDYRLMNYCFEKASLSLVNIYELYDRLISPTADNKSNCDAILFYYKNENGIIGRFIYAEQTKQVISWDEDWQIRKLRTCTKCGKVEPVSEYCRSCGNETFAYKNAEVEELEEDLIKLRNPYEEGRTNDPANTVEKEVFLEAGTEIPYYKIRRLPFVPRPAISSLNSIYGISEVTILLDMQDTTNKILTKVADKILKSGAVVTHPNTLKIDITDETMKVIPVQTAEQAAMITTKQVQADVASDLAGAQLFYESARASSGITESYQGKKDNTATSGKAKELNATQTAGRLESVRVMKASAFAGVYELMLMYLLAYSDEDRKFVRTLPDGKKEEYTWNKYMFLRKDENNNIYYADDFAFSTDPAATLSNNRVQMWQETLQQFTIGTLGVPTDSRTLTLYWNIMASMQYPLAKVCLAGIEEAAQHLPAELEQAIMQNPQILEMVKAAAESMGEQRGGARANSGPEGNGNTHTANVNKTNLKNKAETERTSNSTLSQMTGGNV